MSRPGGIEEAFTEAKQTHETVKDENGSLMYTGLVCADLQTSFYHGLSYYY